MKKYYLYDNQGNVKSISDGIIGYDKKILNIKEIETTKEQDDKIGLNYRLEYKNNKLEIQEPPLMKKEKLKKEIQQADTIEKLKNILNKLT